MRGKAAFILLFILSCTSDFFPSGLYDYQVERLLTDGDTKSWFLRINSENCQDSVRLIMNLVPSTSNDSVSISRLERWSTCNGFDTTFLGTADASSFSGALLFTDSLIFNDGNFWIVQEVTSHDLKLSIGGQEFLYTSIN